MNEKRTQDQRPVYMGTYSKQIKHITDQLSYLKEDVKNTSKISITAAQDMLAFNKGIKICYLLCIASTIASVLAVVLAMRS